MLSLLCASWLVWIVAALFVNGGLRWKGCFPYLIQDLLSYGKIQTNAYLKLFRVPKRWFGHFYLWGTLWNVLLLVHFTTSCVLQSPWTAVGRLLNSCLETALGNPLHLSDGCHFDARCRFEVLASLILICLQVSRRLYECLSVSVFSSSATMHVFHYVMGIYFYTAIGPTALMQMGSGESIVPTFNNL